MRRDAPEGSHGHQNLRNSKTPCVLGSVSYYLQRQGDRQSGGLRNSHMVTEAGMVTACCALSVTVSPHDLIWASGQHVASETALSPPHGDNVSSTRSSLKKQMPDVNGLQKLRFLFSLKWV